MTPIPSEPDADAHDGTFRPPPALSAAELPSGYTSAEVTGGLFNRVRRIEGDGRVWYVKAYVDTNTSATFSPPPVPKEDRAYLAYTVQKLCRAGNCS